MEHSSSGHPTSPVAVSPRKAVDLDETAYSLPSSSDAGCGSSLVAPHAGSEAAFGQQLARPGLTEVGRSAGCARRSNVPHVPLISGDESTRGTPERLVLRGMPRLSRVSPTAPHVRACACTRAPVRACGRACVAGHGTCGTPAPQTLAWLGIGCVPWLCPACQASAMYGTASRARLGYHSQNSYKRKERGRELGTGGSSSPKGGGE